MYITKKFGSCFGLWVQRYNNILNNRICFNKKQSKYQNVLIFRLFLVFCTFRGLFVYMVALPSTSCRGRNAASRWV